MKPKLRLKYRLEPLKSIDDNTKEYEFEIYKMDEKFREENLIGAPKSYITENGYKIFSLNSPHISTEYKVIWLRGINKSLDSAKIRFKASEEQVNEIHSALKEWALNWFKNKK